MSTVLKCDRCGNQVDPDMNDGWVDLTIGVRGSNDAVNRHDSRDVKEICAECDNELYSWFWRIP